MRFRYRAAGVDVTASNYYTNGNATADTSINTYTPFNTAGTATSHYIGNAMNGSCLISMIIGNPEVVARTNMWVNAIGSNATDMSTLTAGNNISVTTSFDGFTIFPEGGTITGIIRAYGYQNS
jgi:hypothetical protein